MSDVHKVLVRLFDKVNLLLPKGGIATLIDNITCIKMVSSNFSSNPALYSPALIYIINGKTQTAIGEHIVSYQKGQIFINAITLPAQFKVIDASEQDPYIVFKIEIDPNLIAKVMASMNYKFGTQDSKDNIPCSFATIDYRHLELSVLEHIVDLKLNNCTNSYPYLLQLRELYYHWLTSFSVSKLIEYYLINKNIPMAQVIDFIENNYNTTILVEDLAKICQMSQSSFFKNFKQATSMSPLQYIKSKRLLEARNLLVCFNYKVNEASKLVGYVSEQQFSREYKKFFGISPKQDVIDNS